MVGESATWLDSQQNSGIATRRQNALDVESETLDMSNTRHLKVPVLGKGTQRAKWQIRLRSERPTLLEDTETIYATPVDALQRLRQQIKRTSYMVNGPNREVYWAVDWWDGHKFQNIASGTATMKSSARLPNENRPRI